MNLLDTRVVSELMRSAPDLRVIAWLQAQPMTELATSSITVAEIGAGIASLPAGARQRELRERWQQLRAEGFGDERVLPFDDAAAGVYGELAGRCKRGGRTTDAFDLQIAAIAATRGLRVVTRNVRHFAHLGVEVLDPWSPQLT
jgi:predicted nucleic acid-binding protein